MTYSPGDTVRISTTVKNDTGALADPATILFKVKNGSTLQITTYTLGVDSNVVRDSIGIFHCDAITPDPGQWAYRIETTSPAGVEEGSFFVNSSLI